MNLEEMQAEMEDEMVSAGAARYAKDLERGLTNVGPGKALLRKALRPMAEAIEAYRNNPRGRRKGMKFVTEIDAHILADLTMRRVLDCAAKEEALVKTCKAISKAVEWHVKDAALNAASVAIWNKTQERLAKTQSPEFRRKSIDGTVAGIRRWAAENAPDLADRLEDVKGVEWDIDTQIEVGSALIDLFAKSTGLVTTATLTRGKRDRKTYVKLTTGTEEWLRKENVYYSVLRPVHLPMIVPPTDWGTEDAEGNAAGGYRTSSKAGVDFIKSRAKALELEAHDMQDAFDAVNLIQKTPWRVNLSVWKVMDQAWRAGGGMGGVPPQFYEDGMKQVPALSSRLQDMTPEQRKADPEGKIIMTRRREAHTFNSEMKTEAKSFGSLMDVAGRFTQFPAFYHPHKLDWRQRAYPISIFLSPQGDQFNRSLIEFADGKRMGDSENSGAWLAIHGANCFGVDKVSFEARIAWVEENTDFIMQAAMFPFECPFWQTADKPWPFLAFCMEWLAYQISGDDHVTHLPVALDGSNSGLQHLSAMLKDADGARITCVAPGTTPEDVYQMVADEVERVIGWPADDDEWARVWQGKVCRKICKQPTMTYTYSATESGMRNQIAHALRSLDNDAKAKGEHGYLDLPEGKDLKDAANYLAGIVRTAIATRMQKAEAAMTFLQDVARVYSQTGLPLRWTTPLGVPIVQYYPSSTSQRKEIYIDGQRHQLKIHIDAPNKLNKRKSTAGVSPNFVHSMDSTHLLWTVLYCNDVHQLESFSMIHDSFGTHATACDELASATRETFVALYDSNTSGYAGGRLADLFYETIENLGNAGYLELIDEVPALPAQGTFNIELVRESDYFFA